MMGGMDDIVQFLRARLNETAARASAATPGPWSVDDESYAESISTSDGVTVVGGGRWGGEASVFESTADALHIAEHDPARVLAEVDAKRQIIGLHEPAEYEYADANVCLTCDQGGPLAYPCPTLRLLALPYADHPAYRDEWRPTT